MPLVASMQNGRNKLYFAFSRAIFSSAALLYIAMLTDTAIMAFLGGWSLTITLYTWYILWQLDERDVMLDEIYARYYEDNYYVAIYIPETMKTGSKRTKIA
jgi:hypothetical protein